MSSAPCQDERHDLDLAALALRQAADNVDESRALVLAGFLALVTAASLGGPKGAAAGAIIFGGSVGKWLSDDDDVLAAIEAAQQAVNALYDCLEQHEDEMPPSGEFLIIPFDE